MSIEAYITDASNHKTAHIDSPEHEKQSLIVSTRPLKEFGNLVQFFSNPTLGINMGINASTGADDPSGGQVIIEEVYDGLDNPYWSPSIISGAKWTTASADVNHTPGGAFSLKYDNGNIGDTFQIHNPTGDISLLAYSSLTLWVYVLSNYVVGDSISIYGFDDDTDLQIGSKIFIEDYINPSNILTWQKVVIPLSDMGLIGQTLDAIRIEIEAKSGPNPTLYFDDIQFEGIIIGAEALGPQIFKAQPSLPEWWYVDEINLTMATSTVNAPNVLADGTVPYLDYTKFLGVDLEVGVIYQRIVNEQVAFSFPTRSIGDLLSLPNTVVNIFGDENTTFLQCRIISNAPLLLKGDKDEYLRVALADDLSSLDSFRASIGGRIEYRQKPATNEDIIVLNRSLK